MVKKVKMQLVGLDGNAFSLMGAFQREARRQGWTQAESELLRGKAEQLPSSQTTPRSVASNFTWCVSHTYQNPAITCLNWSL